VKSPHLNCAKAEEVDSISLLPLQGDTGIGINLLATFAHWFDWGDPIHRIFLLGIGMVAQGLCERNTGSVERRGEERRGGVC